MASDRGLDFSLVWLPLELLILTKARHNPRWLLLLPPLCLLWVNTHGSILLGLLVVAVELGWSLIPERFVHGSAACASRRFTGSLALALLGSVVASCITPYGPGLLAYDFAVSRNGQISQYITEWNSPNFHSVLTLLVYCVPLAVLVACIWTRRIPLARGLAGPVPLRGGAPDRAPRRCTSWSSPPAWPRRSRRGAPWGTTARRWAGAGLVALAIVIVAIPAVPAGTVSSSQPIGAFNYLGAHPGRIFTQYTWGDYSVARHRATFVDGRTDLFEGRVLTEFMAVTNLTTNPDPVLSAYHVSYVVWAPRTPLGAVPRPRPALARRGPHDGGPGLRPPLSGRAPSAVRRLEAAQVPVLVGPGPRSRSTRVLSSVGRSTSA